MKATINIIAQWTFFSPNLSNRVFAILSAPPDSAIIFPSMVPKPTMSAI
ncbi:hypothetical protein QFZ73_002387 [Peribacillus sp. V2I11]|nr:hypothetical protein [Peribacillus sp. V2I11]